MRQGGGQPDQSRALVDRSGLHGSNFRAGLTTYAPDLTHWTNNLTEQLNRQWYERNTGQAVTEIQKRVFHPVKRWMAATLDGMVEGIGAVFEAKFMLPWSEERARKAYGAAAT
jgi:hypothetical protein